MSEIPFFKPYQLNGTLNNESAIMDVFNARLEEILTTRQYSQGENVFALEEEIKELLGGVEYVHTCGSGSLALLIALQAIEMRRRFPFNLIAIPAFAWQSDLWAVFQMACMPLFMDISLDTWCVETPNIPYNADAVIALHTFGNVTEIETPPNVPLIYDAAHAWGAPIKEWGDITIFSMAPTKNLTTGEGGVLVTNDRALSQKIVEYRDQISRLTEFNAIVGRMQLQSLPIILERHKAIAEYYTDKINELNTEDERFKFQISPIGHSHNYYAFCANPEMYALIHENVKEKVELRHYYNPPLVRGLPNTEMVAPLIIHLPIYDSVEEHKVIEGVFYHRLSDK